MYFTLNSLGGRNVQNLLLFADLQNFKPVLLSFFNHRFHIRKQNNNNNNNDSVLQIIIIMKQTFIQEQINLD